MLETDRLILRRWEARDLAPFAALNADQEVMRYFPKALTRSESDAFVARLEDRWTSDGISIAVAERKVGRQPSSGWSGWRRFDSRRWRAR